MFISYLIFVISYFLHLSARFPFLGLVRFDLLIMALLLVFSIYKIIANGLPHHFTNVAKYFYILILYIIITIPFVKWPGSVIRFGLENYLKVIMFFFYSIILIDSKKKLKIFVFVFIACQIFRVFEPLFLHITTGYWGDVAYSMVNDRLSGLERLAGAPHDVVNPNQLAWVANTALPFFFYFFIFKQKWWIRIISLTIALAMIYTLLLTGSRSGLLSLIIILLSILFLSEVKPLRIIVALGIFFLVTILSVNILSPEMKTRYLSIVDHSVEGGDTAAKRVSGLKNTASSILERPIVGHGLNTSQETNFNFGLGGQPTHNLYIEVLQELGLLGFILFLIYIRSIFIILKKLRVVLKTGNHQYDFDYRLVFALSTWLYMHLFYSVSCFGLASWEWYLIGGIVSVHYDLFIIENDSLNIAA